MEESVQQEPQEEPQEEPQPEQPELEYNIQNEAQGDIRRRLRDRDLLKKRKAEAEEKEIDQWDFGTESPKKRGRTGSKRGGRRGRPRKTEPTVITEYQNETALDQEAVAVTDAILDQTQSSLEAEPVSTAPPAPVSIFEQLKPTSQAPVTSSEPTVDTPPIPAPDMAPAPVAAPLPMPSSVIQDVIVQPMYTEPQSKPALNQILIEDLGPDEEADLGPPENKEASEDLSEKAVIPPEPTFLSNPTLSSQSPQGYVPGNSF